YDNAGGTRRHRALATEDADKDNSQEQQYDRCQHHDRWQVGRRESGKNRSVAHGLPATWPARKIRDVECLVITGFAVDVPASRETEKGQSSETCHKRATY